MNTRFLLLTLGLLALTACGVKTDLDPPPGAQPQTNGPKSEESRTPDPSKPPHPLGQ